MLMSPMNCQDKQPNCQGERHPLSGELPILDMTDCPASVAPMVSVIVPVYNVEEYLDTCVSCLRNQTLTDIEIVLVDDGSPDRCPQMCDDYARIDSRIKVVHKKNGGLGYARNSGLEVASGRYVAFVDSDDFIALNTLEVCVRIAEKSGADQVRFLYSTFANSSVPDICNVEVPDFVKNDGADSDKESDSGSAQTALSSALTGSRSVQTDSVRILSDFPDKALPILDDVATVNGYHSDIVSTASSCMALYRREAILRSGVRFCSERELISEDYVFNLELAPKIGPIAYTSYPFYFYRVNPLSLSKMYRDDRLDRCAVFARYLTARLQELGYPDAGLMGAANMIGNLRSHLRHIYASDFSALRKLQLHHKAVSHPYIKEIVARGEHKRLPLLQRVSFACRNSYILSRILTDGRAWMKARLKK